MIKDRKTLELLLEAVQEHRYNRKHEISKLDAAIASLHQVLENGTRPKRPRQDKRGRYECRVCDRCFTTKQGRATHTWKTHPSS